jgi:hypothetical protein
MPSFKVGKEGSELVDNPVELLGALGEYGAQIVRQELKNEVALTIATGAGPGEEEAPETE